MFGNRWYDHNPKVSLAVGCIEQADEKLRNKIAKVIIKHAFQLGIKAKRPSTGLFRRWYDKDKDLSLAMEYFKNANEIQRLDIAEHILFYVREKVHERKDK